MSRKGRPPLLKCEKCDACYKCLGLAPCTEPKIGDPNPKCKQIREVGYQQANEYPNRSKPNPLPLFLSATTHTAAKVGTNAHKRKKTLAKKTRRRARAAKKRTRLRAATTPSAHTTAEADAGAQPSARSRAAILTRITETQKRTAAKNKRAYKSATNQSSNS
jgi:hypothetical protein